MKKYSGDAVVTLLLLPGCLVLPTSLRADSIYGPSGALAVAAIGATDNGSQTYGYCTSGFIPSAAACDTGTVLGFASSGDAFSSGASSSAALANAGLAINLVGVGADTIQEAAGVQINDTIFFHGGNAQQTGQITMTATGTLDGKNSYANETLVVHFTYPLNTPFGFGGNGPWINSATTSTNRPGSFCGTSSFLPTEACASSDGQNLSLSITFPLSVDGVYFEFAMTAGNSGDGGVNYTDPITLTLPPGVTFTSDSGKFLTQQGGPTSVPEPSSALLLGIGMAGIVGLRQTQKRVSRPFVRRILI